MAINLQTLYSLNPNYDITRLQKSMSGNLTEELTIFISLSIFCN